MENIMEADSKKSTNHPFFGKYKKLVRRKNNLIVILENH